MSKDVAVEEMVFRPSAQLSLGVELELQLLRAHDLDLGRDARDLLARLARQRVSGEVKPEITESMIELNTSVHTRYDALRAELVSMRDVVVHEADVLNLGISGGGAHPFHNWADRRIYPSERFRYVLERYGYLAKQFTVFGQHVHVGCPSGDDAIYLAHMMTRHVPQLIALAAASPFYQGEDTSFQSSRLNVVNAFPLAGHIPFVHDWAEFVAYYEKMRGFGVVASMKDFYWDVRPKPGFGTLELRVCDTPLTVERAALLAAYVQAIAAYYLAERPYVPRQAIYVVNAFNRFEACRFGLRGELIEPFEERKKHIGEDVLDTLATVMPHAERLGSAIALARIATDVRRGYSDAQWLRERYAASGALRDVVREATNIWSARR